MEDLICRFVEDKGVQYIEGLGSKYNHLYQADGMWERVAPFAFSRSIADGHPIEAKYNHSRDHLLARSDLGNLKVWESEQGLHYRIQFNPSDPDHIKVKAKIDAGLVRGSSFQGRPKKYRFLKEDGKYIVEHQELELVEVGPVNNPANSEALAMVRSADCDRSENLKSELNRFIETQKRLERHQNRK